MKKRYESPHIIEIQLDRNMCVCMSSNKPPTNGSGKTPPGWNNPHNPHNPHNANVFEDNVFSQNVFE